MQINLKLSKDFERCLEDLKKKYGEDFEYINGLHPSQLDYSEFIDKFVDTNTLADASIDPNANANHKDIRSFMTEKGKSSDKLFALNKIFNTIKKQWGLRTAKLWLEQEFSKGFYLNDSATSSYFPYCWANDLSRLATEGLFFLNGTEIKEIDNETNRLVPSGKHYNNQPPKHLTTFLDDVIEFISFLSNRQSGAVGIPNIVVWSWYFWHKDVESGYYIKDPDYYFRQCTSKLLYRLNQPFLRIDQSAFTNVSIFDHPYMESLFGGMIFPDGTYAIDYIDEMVEIQKVFMEVVSEIREDNMFTYPVLTYSLLIRDDITDEERENMIKTHDWNIFVDVDFAKWCCAHNMKWNDSNFFCSSNVGVLSNCCFAKEQPVLYKRNGKCNISYFGELYDSITYSYGDNIQVYNQGNWCDAKVIRLPARPMYNVITEDGCQLLVTDNHIHPTSDGEKTTKELVIGDELLYNMSMRDVVGDTAGLSNIIGTSKVCSISRYAYTDKYVYCFEVEGDPYFTLPNGIVTHNCRLLSDTKKLDAFINSIGGTALSVGSCRVNTMNLVRIAYESGFDKKKYLKILKDRTTLCCKALYSMRHIIKRNIEKGLLPNYQNGAVELDKQFCTIGGIGIYEVMDLFGLINTDEFGNKSYSDDAVQFTSEILAVMNEVKDNFTDEFSYNIEMIPGENCAGVICQADNLIYEQNRYFIYSNQWIPLMEKCTIQEKCRLGSLFDHQCGGGCIAHINVENRFPNEEVAWDMLNYVAAMGVIYFAFTTKISVCQDRHAFIGSSTCPKCGKPIADTFARVVG